MLSKVDGDTRRKRSTDDSCAEEFTNYTYNEAKRLNLNCYTAAEMEAQSVESQSLFHVGDGNMYGGFHNAPLESGSKYNLYIAGKAYVIVSIIKEVTINTELFIKLEDCQFKLSRYNYKNDRS